MDAIALSWGALTPLGAGERALPRLEVGAAPEVAVADDAGLRAWGLGRPAVARVAGFEPGEGRAEALLLAALGDCVAGLERAWPSWRGRRVGLVLGTSSGGMPAAEAALEALAAGARPGEALLRRAPYGAPFAAARRALGVEPARAAQVLAACASSTFALGVARLWLELGACDLVFAGGYDALARFVTAGFAALGAVTPTLPRPFRLGRDGLALGEGAAVVALARASDAPGRGGGLCLGGFAASTDAAHLTAPDREGAGLALAFGRALEDAGLGAAEVGAFSAHGTATVLNDAAEARALERFFGPKAGALPAHALKGATGHLLGAAGVVEALAMARSLEAGVLPGSAGGGGLDPEAFVNVSDRAAPLEAGAALKSSLAFGGANAVLALRRRPARLEARAARPAAVAAGTGFASGPRPLAELAARLSISPDRLARSDALTHLVLDAIASLAERVGRRALAGAGLVVGHDLGTVATNEIFYRRVLEKGPRAAEPRKFPFTSPNVCAGEAAIVFGLRGPTLSVGGEPGGPAGARELARELVAGGLCPACVAVEVQAPPSPFGDLLWGAAGLAAPREGAAVASLVRAGPLPAGS
ncbi:MAG TPA: beta-ketoacyl synthase N-terminal-like domain-containing protein [Polyangiaceae bacterium]|nr:beta-ketoacyl synthase N-terminal-like domain-containing protein [Polyangiaceae bacterium]